ncbi:DTW domain-containing protein [Ferrimonas sediminicola]|uniref:tRNA-uridine aminocarboxypropyltransferase n=1 Tax=Ferrimonas sediminicola TaxID=2569538 RepID=A0A4U1BKL0_9GAMM|nr:tRNA-uridine aminocarboxypropyltransferase [Ferrimonas sediminicola]TKB51157.1 DTW domain-containing protein [Ferrimonas sediminicola]
MSQRRQCPRCLRPQSVCLCPALGQCASRHAVTILRHPSEAKSAKGTAHLCALVLAQCALVDGETEADFAPLREALSKDPRPLRLLYPGEQATPLESLGQESEPCQLLVLDGTWKKVHRMLQLNPWLQALPKVSFRELPQGNYQIRKAKRTDSLSTLEAVAYALPLIDHCDTTPLMTAFEALKQSQLAHMPPSVRKRYPL